MKKSPLAAARKGIKGLVTGNPVTGRLYKMRFERHLRRILVEHCSPCEVQPAKRHDCYALRKGDRVIIVSLKDAVLGGMIADRFDVLFATQPDEVNGLKVVDYSKPGLHTLTNGLQFEFSSLPENVSAIDDQIAWYKPKPGDIVFDCGANVGITSYYFSKMVGPGGHVICFEPDQISLIYLHRNIARHHLENVTVVEAAVGGADGTAHFFSEGTVSSGMARVLARKSAGDVIEVPVVSLATAFQQYGVPNLCKIDIEGAEIEALDSAAECFASLKINFVVDTDHWVNGEPTAKRVEAIFKRAGYETETLGEAIPVTYARRT
jgi:FkbM family methyltransferase